MPQTTTDATPRRPGLFVPADRQTNERIARRVVWAVIVVLTANQFLIGSMAPPAAAASRTSVLKSLFGAKGASAQVIIAPELNPDGRTSSLVEQPTITDLPSNPNSGNAVADAKVVMLATGAPFYAPDGITFEDPVTAEKLWAEHENVELNDDLMNRYSALTDRLLCSYCCGEPGNVTRNRNCGCAHAKAARGFFKYMLQTYGQTYSNEQLLGEAFRWQAIWYPKGAVEDYLLATGKGDVIGHQTHGGAGADGMHGLTK